MSYFKNFGNFLKFPNWHVLSFRMEIQAQKKKKLIGSGFYKIFHIHIRARTVQVVLLFWLFRKISSAAGASASLFLSSSALLTNVVIKYPEFRDLLNDKEMTHILEIFDVINYDFQKNQDEMDEMENEELRQRNRMNIDDGNDNFEDEINLNDTI